MRYLLITIVCLYVLAFQGLSCAHAYCLISAKTGHVARVIDENNKPEVGIGEKLASGWRLSVENNSTIRLCFLNSGRIEEWAGPVTLIINDGNSSDTGNIKVAAVSNYEEAKTVFRGSDIYENRLQSGVTIVRGGIEDKKLNAAEENDLKRVKEIYVELARKLPTDDYLADFYYIANLERLEQHATLRDHVNKMKEMMSKQQ